MQSVQRDSRLTSRVARRMHSFSIPRLIPTTLHHQFILNHLLTRCTRARPIQPRIASPLLIIIAATERAVTRGWAELAEERLRHWVPCHPTTKQAQTADNVTPRRASPTIPSTPHHFLCPLPYLAASIADQAGDIDASCRLQTAHPQFLAATHHVPLSQLHSRRLHCP